MVNFFYISLSFYFNFFKKNSAVGSFLCCFCVALFFAAGIHSQWIRNLEGRLLKVNLPQELGLNLN